MSTKIPFARYASITGSVFSWKSCMRSRIFSSDASSALVKIEVYNVRGQLVKTLVDGIQGPGEYSVVWNGTDNMGRNVGSGIYFYRIKADRFTATRKMVVLK